MNKYKKAEILEKVKPQLLDLEHQRREVLASHQKVNRILISVFLTGFTLFIYLALFIAEAWSMAIGVFFIFIIGISSLVFFLQNRKKRLEQSIGEIILKAVNPEWTYNANGHLSKEMLQYFGFSYFSSIDVGENLVEGQHGDTKFAFSFLSLGKDGKDREIDALFLIADFHKNIKGRTMIFPDLAQQALGTWLGKKVQEFGHKDLDLVYLEDPNFEKQFAVYSSDQVEARYILSPSMMEHLLKLSRKYNNTISFSFRSNEVGVFIEGVPSFRSNYETSIYPDGTFYHFYRPIEIVTEVIDTLNLNTRIWEKN